MTKARTIRQWAMIVVVVCALTVGAAFTGSRSAAATPPKLFTTFTEHRSKTINHFAVRPADSITDSADGGELKFHWTSWTAKHATGYGRAYPDHGSWAFTVVASAPVSGDFPFPVFTRMKFVNHIPGRGTVHNTLALAYLIGDALGWGAQLDGEPGIRSGSHSRNRPRRRLNTFRMLVKASPTSLYNCPTPSALSRQIVSPAILSIRDVTKGRDP